MDQLLTLLRGQCDFCGHLKLFPVKISWFICKLRLIHHGLLKESQELDDVLSAPKPQSRQLPNGVGEQEASSEEEGSEADDIGERLEEFTKRAIRNARRMDNLGGKTAQKIGAIAEERRSLVKEFLAAIKKAKICGRCKG